MKMLYDKVAVALTPKAEKQGLLYVTVGDDAHVVQGTVKATGAEVEYVGTGDTVWINKFTSAKVTISGAEFYILKEVEILVVE